MLAEPSPSPGERLFFSFPPHAGSNQIGSSLSRFSIPPFPSWTRENRQDDLFWKRMGFGGIGISPNRISDFVSIRRPEAFIKLHHGLMAGYQNGRTF